MRCVSKPDEAVPWLHIPGKISRVVCNLWAASHVELLLPCFRVAMSVFLKDDSSTFGHRIKGNPQPERGKVCVFSPRLNVDVQWGEQGGEFRSWFVEQALFEHSESFPGRLDLEGD